MEMTHFLLIILGLVLTAQAQDCPRPEPGANMVLKGSDILLNTFPSGSKATFGCNVGYTSGGGSGVVTCTAGTWSSPTLRCQRKSCGSAGQVENGDIEYPTGNEFGAKIVIRCNPGFTLVGRREITCGDRGWMDRLPICEVTKCEPPSQIPDGTFSPVQDEYNYQSVVTYECTGDRVLSGPKQLTCSEDGTFQPDPPKCIQVECEDPKVPNGEWVSGSRPPHKHRATVTYRCYTGFKMEGEATLVCGINSQWTPQPPNCIKMEATPPPKPMPVTTPAPPTDDDTSTRTIVGLVVGLSIVSIALIFIVVVYKKKRQSSRKDLHGKQGTKSEEEVTLS